jgi:hypothetical protein
MSQVAASDPYLLQVPGVNPEGQLEVGVLAVGVGLISNFQDFNYPGKLGNHSPHVADVGETLARSAYNDL